MFIISLVWAFGCGCFAAIAFCGPERFHAALFSFFLTLCGVGMPVLWFMARSMERGPAEILGQQLMAWLVAYVVGFVLTFLVLWALPRTSTSYFH